ncbi:MAG: cell division protein ZapA [Candidatus Contendobacter sp.]|nr:cell division protein ZapA [Candidatus Contendobacter sp.]
MNQDMIGVTVQLIGHEYRFACPPAEQNELLEAASGLDKRMQDIRDQGGKLLSLEAVAVMAALNLSHELLRQQRQAAETEAIINAQVLDLLQKLDAFLGEAAL